MAIVVFSLDDNGASNPVRVDFGGNVLFEVTNTFSATVEVQESTDLQAWKVIDSRTAVFSQRYDNNGPLQAAKYYRTVVKNYVSGTVDSTMTSFAAASGGSTSTSGSKLQFATRRSATQSIPSNVETAVLFTVELLNNNAGTDSYNATTGEYTFGQDRVCQVTASVKWGTPTLAGTRSLMINKNGTVLRAITDEIQAGNSQIISSLESFTAGDILTITCFTPSETILIVHTTYTGNDGIWFNLVEV